MRRPSADSEALDAKRSVRRTRIERRAALGRAHGRNGSDGWRVDGVRYWRRVHERGIQPRIDDGRRQFSRLMAERRRMCLNTRPLGGAPLFVTRRLGRRLCAVMMTREHARQLAGGSHHRGSNEDHHEQPGNGACQQRVHRNTHGSRPARTGHYDATWRKRRALAITETELNVIAALAIIGLNSSPNMGYNTPAAIGTPSTL